MTTVETQPAAITVAKMLEPMYDGPPLLLGRQLPEVTLDKKLHRITTVAAAAANWHAAITGVFTGMRPGINSNQKSENK